MKEISSLNELINSMLGKPMTNKEKRFLDELRRDLEEKDLYDSCEYLMLVMQSKGWHEYF